MFLGNVHKYMYLLRCYLSLSYNSRSKLTPSLVLFTQFHLPPLIVISLLVKALCDGILKLCTLSVCFPLAWEYSHTSVFCLRTSHLALSILCTQRRALCEQWMASSWGIIVAAGLGVSAFLQCQK